MAHSRVTIVNRMTWKIHHFKEIWTCPNTFFIESPEHILQLTSSHLVQGFSFHCRLMRQNAEMNYPLMIITNRHSTELMAKIKWINVNKDAYKTHTVQCLGACYTVSDLITLREIDLHPEELLPGGALTIEVEFTEESLCDSPLDNEMFVREDRNSTNNQNNEKTVQQESKTLSCANSMVSRKGFDGKSEYKQVLVESFRAEALEFDFLRENGKAVNEINEWMKQKTNNMIPTLVQSLGPSNALILLNAVYFKLTWMKQLPHTKNGINEVEANLSPSLIQDLKKKLWEQGVKITLPRFRLECTKPLIPYFSELGVKRAFNTGAELKVASDSLAVSEILHKAVIDVNEEGSEAAAATMVCVKDDVPSAMQPEFVVNHPFFFFFAIYNLIFDHTVISYCSWEE